MRRCTPTPEPDVAGLVICWKAVLGIALKVGRVQPVGWQPEHLLVCIYDKALYQCMYV